MASEPGIGSTFSLWLPAASSSSRVADVPADETSTASAATGPLPAPATADA
ncbi:MAG: hypothetical protein U5R31_12700 [Acidimicrobiia bacterium]|nr:hypothetical protein [Acidimicrobiia bacterium]